MPILLHILTGVNICDTIATPISMSIDERGCEMNDDCEVLPDGTCVPDCC